MEQPVREPVPRELSRNVPRDRSEIQVLIDKGLVSMRTCSYNGTQENVPMDFLEVHIYQFEDDAKAQAFFEDNTKIPPGSKGSPPESPVALNGLCDKAAISYGINGAQSLVVNRDIVFGISARVGMNGNGTVMWEAVHSLLPIAVKRL